MKLYEITETLARILSDLDETEDEGRAAALREALDDWRGELNDKLVAVAAQRESMLAEAEAVRAVIKRQQARVKALESRAEWLEGYAIDAMRAARVTEVRTPQMVVRVRMGSGAVEITNEAAIPEAFWRVKEVRDIDKAALRESLLDIAKTGAEPVCPGARLTFKERLEVK